MRLLEQGGSTVRHFLLALFSLVAGLMMALPSSAHAQFSLDKSVSAGTCSEAGDVIDYAYILTNATSATVFSVRLTDDKVPEADIGCPADRIDANSSMTCTGRYTVTADDIEAGSITNIANVLGRQRGRGGITIVNARDEATVTCTTPKEPVEPDQEVQEEEEEEEAFDSRRQTKAVAKRFIDHRLRTILDNGPDGLRFIRRFPGALWGGNAGQNAPPIDIASAGSSGGIAFSTSLSQMTRAVAGTTPSLDEQAMALGGRALYERPGPAPYRGIDVWTEGQFSNFDDRGGADGNVDILYVGADYALTNNWIVGVVGQFDWAEESTRADGSRVKGNGWMVGPYVSGRLDQNLFFDWRAAWGASDNDISPFGTYTDSFETDRWLTTARLTGNWTSGNWRLTPSVSVKYGEEDQDAYTDSSGFRIQGQDARLGIVEFGPEFGYRWTLADGTVVEPHLSIVGLWNFEDSGRLLIADTLVSPDDFTGRLEGGALVYLPRGWAIGGTAAYDGIGSSDYDAVTGKVWLNMPLN